MGAEHKQITLRIPEDVHEALQKRKKTTGLSMGQQIRSVIVRIVQEKSRHVVSQSHRHVS